MPTRKQPSCSLNTIDWTFGLSTTASMMANWYSGTRGDLLQGRRLAEADDHDRVEAALGELAQRLLALASFWGSNSRYSVPYPS